MRRSPRATVPVLIFGITLLATAWACGTDESPVSSISPRGLRPTRTVYGSCVANFTMVTQTDDPEARAAGIPVDEDEVRVCETWTGSDYLVRYETVNSTLAMQSVPPDVLATEYASGYLSGYDANGVEVAAPTLDGATFFDVMGVDETTRAAALDDPYYAIRSNGLCDDPTLPGCDPDDGGDTGGGGGGEICDDPSSPGCSCDPETIICEPQYALQTTTTTLPALSVVFAQRQTDDGKFRRHGIRRRGVRALVENMEELPPSSRGYRRFRSATQGKETILTVHARLGLLVGEEVRNGALAFKARHVWKRTRNGYIRAVTVTESTDSTSQQPTRTASRIEFHDVRIAAE